MIRHALMLLLLDITLPKIAGDDHVIPAHCIDGSHDDTQCTRGCKPGYRGAFCNETCSQHCGGACSQDTGHCLTGCKPNWFTSTCSQPCSGNCVDDVCDKRSAECLRGCKDGFYGLNCNETCSANCTYGKCDINGGCHCKKGVLDKFCYIDCTDNCIGGMCAVDHNGQLKCLQGCKEGRMGLFCNERYPYDCPACVSFVSRVRKRRIERDSLNNCRESSTCKDGYRGRDCDISCPACRYDRYCNLSCSGGSWGEECNFECPQHCSRTFDGRNLCDHERGMCHSGCLQGYFGYKCEFTCPARCNKNYCYMNNGSCTNGCDPEYWGPSCEYRCGKCMDMKCQQNGSCTCIEGYYGPRCTVECSDRCNGNCSITMNGSHICETECKTGFTGVDCQARCPSDCRSRGCSKEDGTCEIERKKASFRCIYPCLECLDTATWLCTRCQEGKFGQRCDHDCSNCLYNKCYINGSCIEGCKSSWWGLKCDSKCKCDFDCDRLTGQFETNDSPCPQNCKKITPTECRVCNSTTRQCLHGCEEGFTGPKCQLTLLVGTEVSTVLPKPRSSCPPPCFQCSNNGTCLKCPGLNGEICSTCGQDGECLDECGAGCAENSSATTESFVLNVPLDIWDQFDRLFKNNALLLPLLCCGLVLIIVVTAGVAWKCRDCKGTLRSNTDRISSVRQESLFAKCGDIHHEIDEIEFNGLPLVPPPVHSILPRPSTNNPVDLGHSQTVQRHQEIQGRLGRQGHIHDGGDRSEIKSEDGTHHYDYATDSTENQSYVTPVHEATALDSNLKYLTPIQQVRENLSLDSNPNQSCPNFEQKNNLLIDGNTERSSYVTAISEAEQSKIMGRSESCEDDVNESLSAVVVDEGCKDQCESPSAVVVDEGCKEQR